MSKNRVLGKGLSALLNGADLKGMPLPAAATAPGAAAADAGATVREVALEAIGFNPDQPRKLFDNNKLEELAESIRQVGVLQPVLVRPLAAGEKAQPHPDSTTPAAQLAYVVVAGERRVRASRLAGLAKVPVLTCTYEETEALKIALLENIQREDLGPIEEAEAYRGLMDAYGATQEELAAMLGKSRSGVANMVRLLTLEPEIRALLQAGSISRGHAKALLGLPEGPARLQLAKLCASRGLSVRDCEQRVQAGGAKPKRRPKRRSGGSQEDPFVRELAGRAEAVYGSPVAIERDAKTGKGAIQVRFYSDDDLVRLLKIMGVDTEL
ncbi:ParB/RepB/Spo0J family partition protein [bacterium]|nr:ParB/RepB/Spo0J family partition protein [bacterium]